MKLIQPIYKLGDHIDTLGMDLKNATTILSTKSLYGKLDGKELVIQSDQENPLGKIIEDDFPFFNNIKLDGTKVTDSYKARINFRTDSTKNWYVESGHFLKDSPYEIEVFTRENCHTYHRIRKDSTNNNRKQIVFNSKDNTGYAELFDVGKRIFNLYKEGKSNYLIFIEGADLRDTIPYSKKYIKFVQMKLDLDLKPED